MARQTRRRKRHLSPKQRQQALRRFAHQLEALVLALVALASAVVTVWGGQGVIPTWTDLYLMTGVSNGSPAPAVPDGADTGQATKIHFIDVGQGDAVLIEQDGAWALIDCGTEACETALLSYLEQAGVTRLDLLVMTHPHADHIGSMDAVLEQIPVEAFWLPQLEKAREYPTSKAFERVLTAAEQQESSHGMTVREAAMGDTKTLGSGEITVVGDGLETDNYNDISLCLRFTCGSFSFLDTGDAETDAEQAMVESDVDLQSTVFKAGHHGSSTSNSLTLLRAVRPQVAVISCGLDNDYGHPNQEALDNFATMGADVYRTDQQGSVVVAYAPESGLQVYATAAAGEEQAA